MGLLHRWLSHLGGWDLRTLNDPSCRLHVYFTYLCVHLSAWTLVLVTLERVVAVLLPLRAPQLCSRMRLMLLWFVMFIFLAALNSYFHIGNTHLMVSNITEENVTYLLRRCDLHADVYEDINPYRIWMDLVVSCALPCILIFFGNALIIIKLTNLSKKRQSVRSRQLRHNLMVGSDVQRSRGIGWQRRNDFAPVTILLIVLCVMFLVTSLPINVYLMIEGYAYRNRRHSVKTAANSEVVFTILSMLYFVNNASNFILYVISGPVFRNTILECFGCRRVRESGGFQGSPLTNQSTRISRLQDTAF